MAGIFGSSPSFLERRTMNAYEGICALAATGGVLAVIMIICLF